MRVQPIGCGGDHHFDFHFWAHLTILGDGAVSARKKAEGRKEGREEKEEKDDL